jgi:hypothetical protein
MDESSKGESRTQVETISMHNEEQVWECSKRVSGNVHHKTKMYCQRSTRARQLD